MNNMQFSFQIRFGTGAQTDASETILSNGGQTKEKKLQPNRP